MGTTPLLRLNNLSELSVQLENGIACCWYQWFAGTLNITTHLSDEKPALSCRLAHPDAYAISHIHGVSNNHSVKELILQEEGSCC